MRAETDFSPEARARRAKAREAEHAADRMLKRAVHMEKRGARAPVGSNERAVLLARARALRAIDAQLRREISNLSREDAPRTVARIGKLTDGGQRQAVRHA